MNQTDSVPNPKPDKSSESARNSSIAEHSEVKSANGTSIDRRPIQSRNTWWAEQSTLWLVSTGITPNSISILGMMAAIVAGLLFASTQWLAPTQETTGIWHRGLWLTAGLLCQVRLLCNLFDGMVAIKRGIASPTGELYNEVPDRVSDAAILVGLGYAVGGQPAFGFTAAIVAIFVAYVRAVGKSIGAPNDFCGPMAKPQRMALVTVLAFYMTVRPHSWSLNWSLGWGEANIALAVVIIGGLLTALRRLYRAAKHLKGQTW